MAVRDMATHVRGILSDFNAFASDTAVNGPVIDTEGFDLGVTFFLVCTVYTAGDVTLTIQEGDLADGSDMANVPNSKLVGFNQGSIPSAQVAALTANGGTAAKLGVHSTKRYVRAVLTSDNSANLSVVATAVLGGEVLPVDDDT
jgi:hypothetical protein